MKATNKNKGYLIKTLFRFKYKVEKVHNIEEGLSNRAEVDYASELLSISKRKFRSNII